MTELDQIGRAIDETHVSTGKEVVIYNVDNPSAHVQSDAYLPLDKVQ